MRKIAGSINTSRVPCVPYPCGLVLAVWPFDDQSLLGRYRRRPSLIWQDDYLHICLGKCVSAIKPSFDAARKDRPSISFQAFRKSSGSENATKPYFAYSEMWTHDETLRRKRIRLRTFWLSRSRTTFAFLNEVYLLKALASTSSETSLLRSPTNRRNQAYNNNKKASEHKGETKTTQGFVKLTRIPFQQRLIFPHFSGAFP